MTPAKRRSSFGSLVLVAVLVTACSQAEPVASPSASVSPSPVPTATAVVPTSTPTATPTATPTQVPTASPTAAADCPIEPETGPPPSDRLVNVVASTTPDADLLTFVFGNDSVEGPGGPPIGEFSAATPPYTFGPSGQPIDMKGERVALIVFRQMSLVADTGDPVYTGPAELSPDMPVLKHAVEYDESEGVIGWYVGYDGPGCATLSRSGSNVTLVLDHP